MLIFPQILPTCFLSDFKNRLMFQNTLFLGIIIRIPPPKKKSLHVFHFFLPSLAGDPMQNIHPWSYTKVNRSTYIKCLSCNSFRSVNNCDTNSWHCVTIIHLVVKKYHLLNNSYLLHRIIDGLPRISKLKI